jgi:acetylornithine deacetylase/succinyl-diaminopimelate desuccinylase-like protein
LALWETPPFNPEVRNDYLYARGAADDKGQIFIHIKAVESCIRADGRPPVNLKFIVEGEEECGGASLAAFLPDNVNLLQADVALISDTAMVNKEQPAIVYGLRGLCYAQLDIQGPRRDLHSGSFGGGIDNPLNVLGHIIAKLKDENGRVLIPGFYEQVRKLTSRERELLAEYPFDENAWLAEAGSPGSWGEPEYSLVERLGARPTLDIHGIIGGYTESGRKTVLPAAVHMKFSMRLVPDQNPVEIQQFLSTYMEEIMPPSVTFKLQFSKGAKASITNMDIPPMKAAEEAYRQVFGRKPVYMREGGSIPVVSAFQSVLGLETILMGFGLPTDQIHAPNERFYLPNFYKGIETSILFMQLLKGMAIN